MASDSYEQKGTNLLISTPTALITLNVHTKQHRIIVGHESDKGYAEGTGGSARFDLLNGFIQDDVVSMLLLDSNNKMLRRVSRTTDGTEHIFGSKSCGTEQDGSFEDVCIKNNLRNIVRYTSDIYYLAANTHDIKVIDFSSRTVTAMKYYGVNVVLNKCGVLYIASNTLVAHNIRQKQYININVTDIADSSDISFASVFDMQTLNNDLIVYSDPRRTQFTLLDLRRQLAYHVCIDPGSGIANAVDSNACTASRVSMWIWNETTMLIGKHGKISSLSRKPN